MGERPPIISRGRIIAEREAGRLYEIEMPNGHHALAVLPQEIPGTETPTGRLAEVLFSPFDMSRCRIAAWLEDDGS